MLHSGLFFLTYIFKTFYIQVKCNFRAYEKIISTLTVKFSQEWIKISVLFFFLSSLRL